MELWLYQKDIFAPDAKITHASNDSATTEQKQGTHYWGIVKDHLEDSIAAISFIDNEINGLIELADHQYVLGKMDNSDLEVFYRDDSLQITPDINFQTPLTPETANISSNDTIDAASNEVKCVMLYIEISYDIYQTFGIKTDAWVASVWSQVLLVFANEDLTVKIKTLKIWDVPDPYPHVETYDFSGTETKLLAFGQRLAGDFDGDIAHLMGFNGNGGSAFVDVLCNRNSGYAYSGVYPT